MFKYTGTWIGNEYWIMYNIYYTRTNRKDGYGNTLTYIIIYCLSPSTSTHTTFNHFIRPETLTTSNLESVRSHRNNRKATVKTANM